MAETDYVDPSAHSWWTQNAEDAGKSLMALDEASEDDNKPRRTRAAYNASLLEGIGLGGFGAWGYGGRSTGIAQVACGDKQSPLIWNYPAAALDTLCPKVAGRDDKPFIMVTDGDWDDERRAIWTTRLLEGLYKEEQGMYNSVHDLGRAAFKIAAGVTGTVAGRVVCMPGEARVVCELRDTLDMWIDAFECSYSNPLTYGEGTYYDPYRLMAAYPKAKQMIWESREPLPYERGGGQAGDGSKTRYMVKLVEGIRCRYGEEPGRRVLAVKCGTIDSKPYLETTPPYAFLHARRSLAGFWGIPVLERGMRIAERINAIVAKLDKAEVLLPKSLLIYDVKRTPRELMKNISDVMQIGFNSEVGGVDPTYITPPLYDQSVINLLEFHIRAFHETLGINQAQMQAKKDPGIVAAAAIRTVNDMFTELFSIIQGDFTRWKTTGLGTLHVKAVQQLSEDYPDFAVNWKSGGKFFKKVKASVCDLGNKAFVFDVMPVSETRDTPADRIQLADEMLARQELSPQAYQRVLKTGDVPRETERENAQYELIESLIDSWMHDDIEDIANTTPLPWLNHGDSIVQVLTAYEKVLMMPKFDSSRELYFRRWITISDQLMKRQEAAKAALQAAMNGGKNTPALLDAAQTPAGQPV